MQYILLSIELFFVAYLLVTYIATKKPSLILLPFTILFVSILTLVTGIIDIVST